MLAGIMTGLGLDPDSIDTLQIVTEQEAEAEHFVGSPTIRIDGQDIVPCDGRPPALTCRLYRRRDGRPGPLPDPDDLRDALQKACTH
jgi:hypothetical protein